MVDVRIEDLHSGASDDLKLLTRTIILATLIGMLMLQGSVIGILLYIRRKRERKDVVEFYKNLT